MPFWNQGSRQKLAAAEKQLLPEAVEVSNVPIGNELYIHTATMGVDNTRWSEASSAADALASAERSSEGSSRGSNDGKNIVLMHGYGTGAGHWAYNMVPFSKAFDRVYAPDWLGHGCSSRPTWRARGVEQSEAFFVDALESWREKQGLEKMVLCGHSIGGYLAVAYTERYPQRVEKLVLASPVGIPTPPPPEEARERINSMPLRFRVLVKTFRTVWSLGSSPQAVVRAAGPWGPGLVDKYVTRRFRDNGVLDKAALSAYLYQGMAQPGSGEYCLTELLAPGAWARKPLVERFSAIKVPTHFLYGERDWMDKGGAEAAIARMDPAVPTSVQVVPQAGHMLNIENPSGFCDMVIHACKL
eukprot:g1271.t1